MNNTKPVSEILEDAADYLEANGWLQDDYVASYEGDNFSPLDKHGRSACALGALTLVQEMPTWVSKDNPAVVALADHLKFHVEGHDPDDDIMSWNDDVQRTPQEVLDAFRACAKEQRQ